MLIEFQLYFNSLNKQFGNNETRFIVILLSQSVIQFMSLDEITDTVLAKEKKTISTFYCHLCLSC